MDNKDIREEIHFEMLIHDDPALSWNTELKLIIIVKGIGLLSVEGHDTTYIIQTGDIFAINAYQLYHIHLDQNAMAVSLCISQSFISTMFPEITDPYVYCFSFLYAKDQQQTFDLLRRDFSQAFRAQYKSESKSTLQKRHTVLSVLYDLFQHFPDKSDSKYISGREHLRDATEYIHRNFRKNVSLSEVAEYTHLSSAYLSRSFRKYFGMTFTEYYNRIRLTKAIQLLAKSIPVTDIAYETGFANTSAFIRAFKHQTGKTPTQFRNEVNLRKQQNDSLQPDHEDVSQVFSYLLEFEEYQEEELRAIAPICNVVCEVNSILVTLKHTWKRLINGGYAKDMLSASVQKQIIFLQQTVGFEYIRCKGMLDDDMVFYTSSLYEEEELSFVYIDNLLDFILQSGAKPMLEFSFMPSLLATKRVQVFKRPTIISAPGNMLLWEKIITDLLLHLKERYGSAMETWLFVPWIASGLHQLGFFSREEYAETYCVSYRAIKRANPSFRVCGAGNLIGSDEENKWFFDMCRENDCLPDILTFRSFGGIHPEEDKTSIPLPDWDKHMHQVMDGDEKHLEKMFRSNLNFLKQNGLEDRPVMLDEWNSNVWPRDLCNDTSFKSAYLFKNVLENYDNFYAMGYFNVSDYMDEGTPVPDIFHGGYGLFTRNGIPKSVFLALQLLTDMGDSLLARGEGYFITKSADSIQVFLYNYAHYDTLYRYRHTTNISPMQRYRVFNEKAAQPFYVRVEGLEKRRYTVRRYYVGPDGGSAYDEWLKMGAPNPLSRQEEQYLLEAVHPVYSTESIQSDGSIILRAQLNPHEIQLCKII